MYYIVLSLKKGRNMWMNYFVTKKEGCIPVCGGGNRDAWGGMELLKVGLSDICVQLLWYQAA